MEDSDLSSRRDTLFDGDTSSSDMSFKDRVENVCKDEGCEDGKITVDDKGWFARGTGVLLDEAFSIVPGSRESET